VHLPKLVVFVFWLPSDTFDEDDPEDLVQRFHRLQINNNVLCQPLGEPQVCITSWKTGRIFLINI